MTTTALQAGQHSKRQVVTGFAPPPTPSNPLKLGFNIPIVPPKIFFNFEPFYKKHTTKIKHFINNSLIKNKHSRNNTLY